MTARGGKLHAIHGGAARLRWPADRGYSARKRRDAADAVTWRAPPARTGTLCRSPKAAARQPWSASPSANREDRFRVWGEAAPADQCEGRVNQLLEFCRRK